MRVSDGTRTFSPYTGFQDSSRVSGQEPGEVVTLHGGNTDLTCKLGVYSHSYSPYADCSEAGAGHDTLHDKKCVSESVCVCV